MIIANIVNLKRPETDNKGKLRQYTEMLGKYLYNNSTRETVTVKYYYDERSHDP